MFDRVLRTFGFVRAPRPAFHIDPELLPLLQRLATEEGKSVEEAVGNLLYAAIAERYTAVENFQPWEDLTPREKQVAALACLGYTNHKIAEQMVISTNTVKTHMRHVLRKFEVSSKNELREVLAGWDFHDWLSREELWPEMTHHPTDLVSSKRANP